MYNIFVVWSAIIYDLTICVRYFLSILNNSFESLRIILLDNLLANCMRKLAEKGANCWRKNIIEQRSKRWLLNLCLDSILNKKTIAQTTSETC